MTSTPLNGWRPKHLSHSSIDKFVRCPRNWYDSYAKRTPFVANRAMLIGSLFGKMIEDAHGGYGTFIDTEHDMDYAPARLKLHYGNLRSNEREQLNDEDIRIIERLFDMYRSREGGPHVGTPEYEFKVYLPDRKAVPYPIKGYMDLRSNDEPHIWEFKTGKWATHPQWGYSQQRADSMAQCAIYWYADKVLNDRDSVVDVVALSYSDRGISMIEKSTHPNMTRVEEVQAEAAKLCAAIEAEEFPCLCAKCKVEAA